jgi:glutamate--cysteine ligase
MPTTDRRAALSHDEAYARSGLTAFPDASPRVDQTGVGLEPEFFPVFVDSEGRPAGRVPLRDPGGNGVLEIVDGLTCTSPEIGTRTGGPLGPWEYGLASGGRLTFEPGAQVEHSTAVFGSAAEALADVDRMVGTLRGALGHKNAVLAASGIDLWHDVDSVPQQLPFGRYTAQAAYYEKRGTWGRVMMRHTASLQINVDLGPDGVWQERWLAANLISPLITASFACSPGAEDVSVRATAWQRLDPTRSGFPGRLTATANSDPREQWAEAAMDADVMLFRLQGGRWEPGEPGFSFRRWLAEGHPVHGWPVLEDLEYHLTTLFFEVRARGFLELRSGEAVPDGLRPAQVILVTGALYDDAARAEVIGLMSGHRPSLAELWRRAASDGVGDSEIAELAGDVWQAALRGAERLYGGGDGDRSIDSTRDFLEEFTLQGRTPADHLRELHDLDPALSLAWASSIDRAG